MKKKDKNDIVGEDEGELSYEELTMLRAGLSQSASDNRELPPHDTSDRAYLFRFIKKNKILTSAAIIIVAALISGIIFGIVMLCRYIDSLPNRSDFTIELGEEDPFTVKYSDAVRDGILYVDMRQIAKTIGMTSSGSTARMQFTASGNSYLSFDNGSEIAIINGSRVEMSVRVIDGDDKVLAKAIIDEKQCLIPYEFLTSVVSEGILFKMNPDTNTIIIKRIHYVYDGDRENAVKADIFFSTDKFTTLPDIKPPVEYEYSYTIDISPYLDSITAEYLVLANKSNPLGENYDPKVVKLTCKTDGENQQLVEDAAIALYAMMLEMEAAGVRDVFVTSSYRSYTYQKSLYNGYVQKHMNQGMTREEAEAAASAYSARPGESEHQTGLCLDFTTDSIHGAVDDVFEGTDAFKWLSENAYKFGFILRYPKSKVNITQYDYEPWHYRFVGRDVATEIHMSGICLEEYLGINS